MSQIKNTGS